MSCLRNELGFCERIKRIQQLPLPSRIYRTWRRTVHSVRCRVLQVRNRFYWLLAVRGKHLRYHVGGRRGGIMRGVPEALGLRGRK